MRKLNLTIRKTKLAENNQLENEKVIRYFSDLSENNWTIGDAEINIQIKPGHYPVKQKATPITLYPPEIMGKMEKLINGWHFEKIDNVEEDNFISPVVITVKKRQIDEHRTNSRNQ